MNIEEIKKHVTTTGAWRLTYTIPGSLQVLASNLEKLGIVDLVASIAGCCIKG